MKGLEAIKSLGEHHCYLMQQYKSEECKISCQECIHLKEENTIIKELKAFEIIKNKNASACNCLMILKCRNDNLSYEQFCQYFITDLDQEEYDLLKEVLL